ncbi:MAG: hypothetical protein ABF370_05890 [Verrucomicrobiales bacterium]|nr:hypothetical protein [Verrucomicrobiaceae bacterium]
MKGTDLDSQGLGQDQPPDSRMLLAADIDFYLERMNRRIGRANTVTIQHPAKLRIFEGLTPSELSAAAAQHDLWIVRQMGGGQLECTRLAMA